MIKVTDFIAYVKIPLQQHWGYIYGMMGQTWTQKKQKIYSEPGHKNWQNTKAYGSQWIGRRVIDCSGVIAWACKQLNVTVSHHAHYLYTDYSTVKGKLINGRKQDGTIPRIGSLVYLSNDDGRKHHVGVYVGNNVVIEAKGTKWGVVTSNLAHWDSWSELKYIQYSSAPEDEFIPEIVELKKAITINPGSWLNLRSGPSKGNSVLARIPRDTEVIVLDQSDPKWWEINYNGKIGYVMSEFLEEIKKEEP